MSSALTPLAVERLPGAEWQDPAFLLTTALGFTVELRAGWLTLLTPCCGDYAGALGANGEGSCVGCDAILPWPPETPTSQLAEEVSLEALEAWAVGEREVLVLALEAAHVRDQLLAFLTGPFAEAQRVSRARAQARLKPADWAKPPATP